MFYYLFLLTIQLLLYIVQLEIIVTIENKLLSYCVNIFLSQKPEIKYLHNLLYNVSS